MKNKLLKQEIKKWTPELFPNISKKKLISLYEMHPGFPLYDEHSGTLEKNDGSEKWKS